jgi:TPR repeat protein
MLRTSVLVLAITGCMQAAPAPATVAPSPAPAPAFAAADPDDDDCPEDLAWSAGGCRTKRPGPAHCDVAGDCVQLCEQRDPKACTELGFAHMVGRKVALDRGLAATYFERACTYGDHYGCNNQAALIISHDAVPIADLQVAIGLFEQSCAREPKLCSNRAVMLRDGIHSRIDKTRAAELFSRACIGGDASSCHDLALAYDKGVGVGRDVPRATELEIQSCRGGFAHACTVSGVRYLYGTGTRTDEREAARYFRHACTSGNLWGCGMVGLMVMDGLGGEVRDPDGGRRQMEHACESGSNDTCAILGAVLRAKGDRAGARRWYRKACEGGLREHCY